MLLNCGVEKTLESPLDCKWIQPVHPKGDQSWVFIERTDVEYSNTLATWCKELTYLKRPWCWERLRAGGEGDDRGWDGWMASPTQWTWVWVDSGSWWWTGRPGVQFMWSQRAGHDWATELNWTELLELWSCFGSPGSKVNSDCRSKNVWVFSPSQYIITQVSFHGCLWKRTRGIILGYTCHAVLLIFLLETPCCTAIATTHAAQVPWLFP